MIYKPTSPSPYAKCVSLNPDEDVGVAFSCNIMGGSEIETARLKISDGDKQCFFYAQTNEDNTSTIPSIENDSFQGSKVSFNMNTQQSYSNYTLVSKQFVEDDTPEPVSMVLSTILVPDKEYTWQVRLYEKNSFEDNYRSNIWLGYGVIQGIPTKKTVSSYGYFTGDPSQPKTSISSRQEFVELKIRPHTNVFFRRSTITSGGTPYYDTSDLYIHYDSNARYFIKVNGKYKKIYNYRYYSSSENKFKRSDLDDYGYPIAAYVYIDTEDLYDSDEKCLISEGDNYEIYCNYIDSDEYYFNIAEPPSLTFVGTFLEELNGTEDAPQEVDYSCLCLVGNYTHSSGAKIEKYNISLFCNEQLIEQKEQFNATRIKYDYNMLLNGNQYKISIQARDTLGCEISKDIFIKPNYSFGTFNGTPVVDFYQPHDSLIVDWSKCELSLTATCFDVYKCIEGSNKLHKVYSTQDGNDTVIEDFIVGSNCKYSYYIYPVYKSAKDIKLSGNQRQMINYLCYGEPCVSPPIVYDSNAVMMLGLIQDENASNVYSIDYNKAWKLELNLENSGTTLNMDKTFSDSQNQFPQMTVGNRLYNTTAIKGLIGRIDCTTGEYVEDFDFLTEWEKFVSDNTLKLLKDIRGRLIPCGVEASAFEYMSVPTTPTTVSFNVRQLDSLENITILGRAIKFNPVRHKILSATTSDLLANSEDELLATEEGEITK